MVRLLINFVIFLIAAAVGLIVAAVVLPDMSLDASSFLLDVLIFAVLRAVLAPFIIKTTIRNARALAGAAGLIATLAALIITVVVSDGLRISGLLTWTLATVIIWLISMFAAFLLPFLILKGLLGGGLRDALRPGPGSGRGGDIRLG